MKDGIFRIVYSSISMGQTLSKSIIHNNLVLLSSKNLIKNYSSLRPISINNISTRSFHGMLKKVLLMLYILISQILWRREKSLNMCFLHKSYVVTDIRKRGEPVNMMIKLDIAKACNRISWLYLSKVLKKWYLQTNLLIWSDIQIQQLKARGLFNL